MAEISRRTAGKLIAAVAVAAPALAVSTTTAAAYEPNMENALHALENAHTWLERASPNKGGHRERAIGMIEQAINEVRAGIAYSGG